MPSSATSKAPNSEVCQTRLYCIFKINKQTKKQLEEKEEEEEEEEVKFTIRIKEQGFLLMQSQALGEREI